MHRIPVTNAAISHHADDDVDLRYHCNAFISLFSVFDLPSIKELKNTYVKEHPWVIASKYSISNTEDNRNVNYVYYLNLAPMEKVWFLAPLEHSHNGKDIVVPMKHIFMVYSPKGKDMVL